MLNAIVQWDFYASSQSLSPLAHSLLACVQVTIATKSMCVFVGVGDD